MNSEEMSIRRRFFNEEGNCLTPFVDLSWRGCCLNRDRFDATLMPRFLFEAVVEATGILEVCIAIYTPDHPGIIRAVANWPAFRSVVCRPGNSSLEHVLFDGSGEWAILGELDVMVLGASPAYADRIDAALRQHGTDLRDLTSWDYPEILSDEDQRFSYMRSVVRGSQ